MINKRRRRRKRRRRQKLQGLPKRRIRNNIYLKVNACTSKQCAAAAAASRWW